MLAHTTAPDPKAYSEVLTCRHANNSLQRRLLQIALDLQLPCPQAQPPQPATGEAQGFSSDGTASIKDLGSRRAPRRLLGCGGLYAGVEGVRAGRIFSQSWGLRYSCGRCVSWIFWKYPVACCSFTVWNCWKKGPQN